MFSRILIANRGEVAVRVIRACKEMGIQTVAVFSQADSEALHVSLADESLCIGPAQASRSYLNREAVLSAALLSHAQAIHPGYGFLSEDPVFAALCEEKGLSFIGPSASSIRAMGDKDEARRTMQAAGVPVIPGSSLLNDAKEALLWAKQIGYPILLKARSGGGGRGIRRIESDEELLRAFPLASAEAQSAFGDGALYLEKYLFPVKHIEMQLIADKAGHVVCLGERECSMQLKNQKVLEESPSLKVDEATRARMEEVCVKAARAAQYEGLGTIEFLLDQNGGFYFMEMNTRLQVEHPVTEFVTGLDLVKWQIRVAAGQSLDFNQGDVRLSGHAIECRVNALPGERGAGRVELLHIPGGPAVRFDTALYQGYALSPFYDSMIGKLIVHAQTREEALRKMHAALCELVIEGLEHNAESQIALINEPEFLSGEYTTDFLQRRGK
ncbi:MAG: acetyl-CoA carboxylase biotin carboxylase subunit [Christensenellaceae bacterium]|jgi:acetyl-CoA carboxylase biotin carboxylase subunit|nr:acetyl-CoA carboxylase biotin carboxylase subunit [Christensenellaceae bacterium]